MNLKKQHLITLKILAGILLLGGAAHTTYAVQPENVKKVTLYLDKNLENQNEIVEAARKAFKPFESEVLTTSFSPQSHPERVEIVYTKNGTLTKLLKIFGVPPTKKLARIPLEGKPRPKNKTLKEKLTKKFGPIQIHSIYDGRDAD
jgi:hypothetical protein